MPLTPTADRRFFGLDASQWPRQWRGAAGMLLQWPPFRWLVPSARVVLHATDGSATVWRLARGRAAPASGADAGLAALELAAGRVLRRELVLPPLAPADVGHAVALDVAASSPFGAEQTTWGYVASAEEGARTRVHAAIASRAHVDEALHAAGFDPSAPPEVWVLPAGHVAGAAMQPIVLQGWGEDQRQRRLQRALRQRLGVLAVVLALVAVLVVTPAFLMRGRAAQARHALDAVQREAQPQLQQREALMQRVERLQQVRTVFSQQLAMPPVLDMLTRALPDGAWLTSLRVDGTKVVLNGLADDAAALVQSLAAKPGAHGVRLASPATRRPGANKETFIIELTLDPALYGPVALGAGAAKGAS